MSVGPVVLTAPGPGVQAITTPWECSHLWAVQQDSFMMTPEGPRHPSLADGDSGPVASL